MSALSKTEVINAALSLAEQGRISSVSDDDPKAREAEKHYDHVRQGVLRMYPWNFALVRPDGLAASATAPSWKWTYGYLRPTDCLYVIEVKNADRNQRWAIERNSSGVTHIVTDIVAPLYISYIADVLATTQWDPLFTQAVIGQLAGLIAAKLGDRGNVQGANDFYMRALNEAKRSDSQEGIPEQPDAYSWENARVGNL